MSNRNLYDDTKIDVEKRDSYEEALKAVNQKIDRDRSNAVLWAMKGIILSELGRHKEALQACEQGICRDHSNAYVWTSKGLTLNNLGYYEEAIKAFNQAIRQDRSFAYAWNCKGNALIKLGRHKEALKAFDQGICRDRSETAACYHGKGRALIELDQYKEALKAFDKALEIFDEGIDRDRDFERTYCGKGNALIELGRYDEALEAFDKAISWDNSEAPPWNGKGYALIELGRYDEALEAFDQSIDRDRSEAAPWYGKGNVLKYIGRPVDARRAYKRFFHLLRASNFKKDIPELLKDFYEEGPQSPLLLLRLVKENTNLLRKPGWYKGIKDIQSTYADLLDCLAMLYKIEHEVTDQFMQRAKGCLAFHLGDPTLAEESFDKLDDYYPEDLLGQYYLVSSRYDYWADISACQGDAVKAALAYHGNDPEQHYYAARIFSFIKKDDLALKSIQKAGEYIPALILGFDMARKKNDNKKMKELTEKILSLEENASLHWRFLSKTSPLSLDVSSRESLKMILKIAKQRELVVEIKDFLLKFDDPLLFDLRQRYASVLRHTHIGTIDLKTSMKLNEDSQRILNDLFSEQKKADLDAFRTALEAEDVNLDKIEAINRNELEALLAMRISDKHRSIYLERRIIVYFYMIKRLSIQASISLMLFSCCRNSQPGTDNLKASLRDAFLGGVSTFAGASLPFIIPNIEILSLLTTITGSSVMIGIASFFSRNYTFQKETDSHSSANAYQIFKKKLRDESKAEQMNLPESFWDD